MNIFGNGASMDPGEALLRVGDAFTYRNARMTVVKTEERKKLRHGVVQVATCSVDGKFRNSLLWVYTLEKHTSLLGALAPDTVRVDRAA